MIKWLRRWFFNPRRLVDLDATSRITYLAINQGRVSNRNFD
jgi:hypothetical protein